MVLRFFALLACSRSVINPSMRAAPWQVSRICRGVFCFLPSISRAGCSDRAGCAPNPFDVGFRCVHSHRRLARVRRRNLRFSMGRSDEQSVNREKVERRKSPRIPFRFPVRMTIISSTGSKSGTAVHVQGHDLSEGGISIIYARKLEVGQELELEMPGRIRAAVVRCVESEDRGRYLLGCQFIDGPSTSPPATTC
jgi:PilZ domain